MIHELILRGINQAERTEEFLTRKIESILDLAPSDSTASTSIERVKKGYSGVIHIFSSQGKFVAEAMGTDFNETVRELMRQINQQISEWRHCRFAGVNP